VWWHGVDVTGQSEPAEAPERAAERADEGAADRADEGAADRVDERAAGRTTDGAGVTPVSEPGPPSPTPEPPPPEPPTAEPEPVSFRTVFRWGVAGGLGVLVVWLVAMFAYNVRDLLVQIAVAAFIALSLDPLVRWLIRHKVGRPYAVTIIFVLFFIVLGVLIWLAVPPLVRQATALASDFPGYLDTVRERSPTLRDLEARFNLKPRLDEFGVTLVDRLQRDALAFGQRFLGALIQALLVIVLTIYFMADLPRIRRAIVRLFPTRNRPHVSHAVNVTIDKVGAYMIGNLLISAIAGVTTFIALTLLGVQFALPLAFFVAITDLIPLIGATLGAVVCSVVAVATTELWPNAILVVAFFIAYQQLENYWIAPVVLRNSVDMPSVAVLLAALLGGSVLGLVGALMAIPIAAVVKVLVSPKLRERDAAVDGGLPQPSG
jgi:predicted PurR-regulated permease PerM